MADLMLAARPPLANLVIPGGHGVSEPTTGVRLRVPDTVVLHGVLASRGRRAELGRAVGEIGFSLPEVGRFVEHDACHLLWAGPDQWTIAAEGSAATVAERLAAACQPHALVAAQSDARAVIEIGGAQARSCLAKLVGIDLHPRAFGSGRTVLAQAGSIPVQLWQTDGAPTYAMSVPRSFAEDVWRWLTHAAAEFGYETIEPAATRQTAHTP